MVEDILKFTEFIGLIFVAFLLWVFWPTFIGTGWLPTPMEIVRRMLEMACVQAEDTVFDLGSGDGRIVIVAAGEFGARAVGVEVDPLRLLWSRLRIRMSGLEEKASVLWSNFFHLDLRDANVVTIYQNQRTNNNLREKLKRELRPGTRVVSYMFTFDGWEPDEVDEGSKVYLYVI